jgi:hypothetical protein
MSSPYPLPTCPQAAPVHLLSAMDTTYFSSLDGVKHNEVGSPSSSAGESLSSRKANALSTKLATVLSSSYADSEIREALHLLDARDIRNDDSVRRNLKFDAQKEVIDANARVVNDFGQVAEVRGTSSPSEPH